MVLNEEMETETLIQFGAQLSEDRLVLNQGQVQPRFLFFFVQNHFLASFSVTFKLKLLFKLSYLNSNFTLTVSYLDPALNNPAQVKIRTLLAGPGCIDGYRHVCHTVKLQGISVPCSTVESLLRKLDPEVQWKEGLTGFIEGLKHWAESKVALRWV